MTDRSAEARSALVWKLMNRPLIDERGKPRRPLSGTEANEVADLVFGSDSADCPEPGCALRSGHMLRTGFKHRDALGFYWWPGETDDVTAVS